MDKCEECGRSGDEHLNCRGCGFVLCSECISDHHLECVATWGIPGAEDADEDDWEDGSCLSEDDDDWEDEGDLLDDQEDEDDEDWEPDDELGP